MYPQRELIRLAAAKTEYLRRIEFHRLQCVNAAQPSLSFMAGMDRWLAFGRSVAAVIRVR